MQAGVADYAGLPGLAAYPHPHLVLPELQRHRVQCSPSLHPAPSLPSATATHSRWFLVCVEMRDLTTNPKHERTRLDLDNLY